MNVVSTFWEEKIKDWPDIIDLLHKNVLPHETQISCKSDAEKEALLESWRNNADED